jgi:hypothetical protein
MQHQSKTDLLLKCLECEHCYSLRCLDGDITCKHPFVMSKIDARPGWLMVDSRQPAWVLPHWCPNADYNVPVQGRFDHA